MTPDPKHYLADVPQELRLRIIDLCIHRQWHDALDLLHQNGFTHYEWFELVWFHDHAPTNLPAVECGGLTPLSISTSEPPSLTADVGPALLVSAEPPESSIQEPASETQTLTPAPIQNPKSEIANSGSLTPLRELRASVVKPFKPRGKIARLPKPIQTNLNTMLASGCAYMDIIRFLNTHGFPGFNKVNLNAWKKTGFRNWIATDENTSSSETDQSSLEGAQKPVVTDTNR